MESITKRLELICNEEGTSIVSVLVAFIILLIGIGMLSTAVFTSQNMAEKSEKLMKDMEKSIEQYYAMPPSGTSQKLVLVEEGKDVSNTTSFPINSRFTSNESENPDDEDSVTLYYFKLYESTTGD